MEAVVLRTTDHTTVTKVLVLDVMGYQVSGDLFLKEGEYPLIISEFNPLKNLQDAFKVLQSITTERYENTGYRDYNTNYSLKSRGLGHTCLIYNDSEQRAGSASATTPEMAICMAVLDYYDIQTDFEDATEKELRPRKEAV